MDRKFQFVLTIAFFHLGIAIVGIWGVNPFQGTFLYAPFEAYGRITGALAQIKFFAPGLKSEIRVRIEGKKRNGEPFQTTLMSGKREIDLRTYNILATFWAPSISKHKEIQRSIVASWAGKVFGQYPDVESITLKVEAVELPSMELARAGAKLYWHEIYRAVYLKKNRHLELINEGA